jgi:preprotein translocase subunit SecD
MEIIEERTIGPSLGAENIAKGFNSVTWGFLVIVAFMCVYYAMFGLFSSLALAVNLLLLVALLSLLQATLTLPGMAAMALALGMAIDSNVLINERVREELRNGVSPQAAIHAGYDRAWATIFDSNITTLIAGVALLAFGSGPVPGDLRRRIEAGRGEGNPPHVGKTRQFAETHGTVADQHLTA